MVRNHEVATQAANQTKSVLCVNLLGLFSDVTIHQVKIQQKYNDHARIQIFGMIPAGDENSYLLQMNEGQTLGVDVQYIDESQEPLFRGMLLRGRVEHKGDVYHIYIDGVSNSYLLDIVVECRSYQNINMSSDQVIQTQMEGIDGQFINYDDRKDEPIGRFTLQYQETRWKFIMRLISRHNEGLIPDILSTAANYYVGLPSGLKPHEIGNVPFESFRHTMAAKGHLDNGRILDADENDFFCYRIRNCLERYQLGDPVLFKGLSLRVLEAESRYTNGELRHDYVLTTQKGCKQPTFLNEVIRGLSLEGSVIDRRKDFTKVHLYTIDEEQDVATASWFRQPTYYTAGKDRGWCAMPELDDQMSLHFPTYEENDCYLMDSTHVPYENINECVSYSSNLANLTGGKKDDRIIPASKHIIAPNRQTLLLEDDLILYHSKDYYSALALQEEHVDEKGKTVGISIRSEGNINFIAQNISLGRYEKEAVDGDTQGVDVSQSVSIYSDELVEFVCALSSIRVENGAIHTLSPLVNLWPQKMQIVADYVEEAARDNTARNNTVALLKASTKKKPSTKKKTSVKKKGSGKDGKLTVKEIENEFAKAAGYDNIYALKNSVTKPNERLKGKSRWKYKMGGTTYGGPVDCAGLFTAVAKENGQDYTHHSTSGMESDKDLYEFHEIKKDKNGNADFSDVPEGAVLWRSGHVGLYINNGREISAKTAKNGENISSAGSPYIDRYTHWSYVPFVDYDEN